MREFLISTAVALVGVPLGVMLFQRFDWMKENWRGVRVAFPAGVVVVVCAAVVLVFVGGVDGANFGRSPFGLSPILLLTFGVAALGFIDDIVDSAPRGLRGHGFALLRGQISTGVLKAVGTLVLTLIVIRPTTPSAFVTVGVIVLTTNIFNLLDLRPGRALKGFVVLVGALALLAASVTALTQIGIFIGPLLIVGLYDLRERAMMGDTGANLLGVIAGIWLVLALDTTGQFVALIALFALTLYGEFRSFSATIERNRLLKWIDQLGRVRRGGQRENPTISSEVHSSPPPVVVD